MTRAPNPGCMESHPRSFLYPWNRNTKLFTDPTHLSVIVLKYNSVVLVLIRNFQILPRDYKRKSNFFSLPTLQAHLSMLSSPSCALAKPIGNFQTSLPLLCYFCCLVYPNCLFLPIKSQLILLCSNAISFLEFLRSFQWKSITPQTLTCNLAPISFDLILWLVPQWPSPMIINSLRVGICSFGGTCSLPVECMCEHVVFSRKSKVLL